MKKSSSNKSLLIPWLYKALNEERYEGLKWQDKKRKIFFIHWTHKSAEQWSQSEIEVCEEWAAHKGKLDGKNEKQLKATFRCALNSKKELREVQRTKRKRYWQFVDLSEIQPGKTKEIKTERKKIKAVSDVQSPCDSIDHSCDHKLNATSRVADEFTEKATGSRTTLPPFDVSFDLLTPPHSTDEITFEADFRTSNSPHSYQSCLTPPSEINYRHLSCHNTFQELNDTWQPNYMTINVYQDSNNENFFLNDIVNFMKSYEDIPSEFSGSHFSEPLELSGSETDQFVPVMDSALENQDHYSYKPEQSIQSFENINSGADMLHLEYMDSDVSNLNIDQEDCIKIFHELHTL